ncbi:ExbD/TolR family protein [Planctomicrobium sp. SH668]|uniref:ExbD/TolR family protein n=1 Tax=Planctomicrobium sp. SH668 TaxID=3448126 RepID=UPI003F5B7FF0
MRRPTFRRKSGSELNLTPLIDVVFNLVIFFLVASHFAASEPSDPVSLPSASTNRDDIHARRLSITVKADGTYVVGMKSVELNEVERLIAQEAGEEPERCAVRIRGDRDAAYAFIEPVMLACARSGIHNFGFKVIQEE